jgi:hypothetical protein
MCEKHVHNNPTRAMKHSKSDVRCKFTCLPQLRFDDQQLSSFSGLIVFQQLISDLDLKRRLSRCFEHQKGSPSFSTTSIVLVLIISVWLGYRRLRDVQFFKDDPIVLRFLGLNQMPTVSTISRQLSKVDDRSIGGIERLQQNLVIEALVREQLATITLDFDGSVLGTCRHAEGVANGFNKKKKGQRSYYPLYCTVAQTAQVLAVHHRSGNVHDSNGAKPFIEECVEKVKIACPRAKIELRMDGAFFSEQIIECLDELGVEYSISVPFERYPTTIKCYIEERKRWRRLRKGAKFFDKSIALDSWAIAPHRFLFVRDRQKEQSKGVIQLDLFKPHDFNYRYKVIVTNKTTQAKHIVEYHEGRGSQEGLFAELKTEAAMSYVPCNSWNANKLFLLSNVIAHNLTRELQMRYRERDRNTTVKRPALWKFSKIGTLRKQIIQRAGRLIRPQGILTLSMSNNPAVEESILSYLPS